MHGGSALGHIGSIIAHAIIYSTVARMIWHAPLMLVALLVGIACFYLLYVQIRGQHRD